MIFEFYVFGERVIVWVRGGGVRNISSPLRGVLNIFRRFWGGGNFMVEFWNTLHPPSTHTLWPVPKEPYNKRFINLVSLGLYGNVFAFGLSAQTSLLRRSVCTKT
jgi:hypothetical protein